MTRKLFAANGVLLSLALAIALAAQGGTARASLQEQEQQQGQKPTYTLAEYNAFQAAASQTNLQAKVQALDDFATKFPNSALMPLAYELYYAAYNQLKSYAKVIEYADKFLAVPDEKIESLGVKKENLSGKRLQALYLRTLAFNYVYNEKDPHAARELTAARQAALEGLKVLGELPKPANMTDEQFAEQKKAPAALMNSTAGFAALQLKDYKDAIDSFQAALENNSKDPVTYFRLGVAYLQLAQQDAQQQKTAASAPPTASKPPQTSPTNAEAAQPPAGQSSNVQQEYMNGFWALAKSIAQGGPSEAQVRTYLRQRMLLYEQPGCDNIVDQQMSELIQLASASATLPATYSIPSADDLNKIRQHSTILSVISDLQASGDKATLTWDAVCGSEFPDVVGKIISVTPGADGIEFKIYTGATEKDMEAATAPNLDIKVEGQPAAVRLQKNDGIRFTGTLVSYDPQPFLLHWDKCKVDPSVIPPEKPAPGRRHHIPRRPPRQ